MILTILFKIANTEKHRWGDGMIEFVLWIHVFHGILFILNLLLN